jgi:hypothetical protein
MADVEGRAAVERAGAAVIVESIDDAREEGSEG